MAPIIHHLDHLAFLPVLSMLILVSVIAFVRLSTHAFGLKDTVRSHTAAHEYRQSASLLANGMVIAFFRKA